LRFAGSFFAAGLGRVGVGRVLFGLRLLFVLAIKFLLM
jgi:hypothetical protein